MKKLFYTLLASFVISSSYAADIIVEEFGTLPTYSSITGAVAAAADGDRIVIKNRAGDIPWIENITIDKSLTFVSYTNNTQFVVQGNYTINRANNREVIIIGMKNTAGSIQEGTGTAGLRATKVSVMDSWFVTGILALDNAAYDVQVVGNKFENGYVYMDYGNVIGNDITTASYGIYISNSAAFAGDTCLIVANKVNITSNGVNAIFLNSTAQAYHVKNNYIQTKGTGLELNAGNSNGVANLIWNNTIVHGSYAGTQLGINLYSTTNGSIWEIMNNVIDENSVGSTWGIFRDAGNAGQINVYYNFIDTSFDIDISPGFTFIGNNTLDQSFAINLDGTLPVGNPAINNGNPAQPFYDLDLTAGDAGAYGASYSLNNFFPQFTGAARVYFVKFPFNVRQGSTLNIKAYGFDR